ncbi:MAG: hypothetical protein ACLU3R_03480 [Acutalibacteraceae bacterium]
MKKVTRHAFSKKAIMITASLFVTLALITTGFAAWLISSGASGEGTGNITTATIDDARLGLTVAMAEGKDFVCFGPQADDTVPHIMYEAPKEGEKDDKEVLTATVTGTIKNYDRLKEFNITIKISDKALTAAGYTWTETNEGSLKNRTYTYNAGNACISLPEYAVDTDGRFLPLPSDTSKTTAPKTISAGDSMFTDGTTENEKKFTFDVTFGWGEKFKGCNPGRYLDREEADHLPDKTYTVDEKKEIMTELRSLFEDESKNVDAANLKFVVTVEAVSK